MSIPPLVLLLGAGPSQAPLVACARRRGLRTVVIAGASGEPGLSLADHGLVWNLRDVEGVVALAKDLQPWGVATVGTDVPVPALAATAEALGLPGPSREAAWLCTDKVAMKARFLERGVPTAPFTTATSRKGAREALAQLGLPAMIKIPDGAGSRGITRLECLSDLGRAWEHARAASRGGVFLVERCLQGVEFGVTALMEKGELRYCLPYNSTIHGGPHPTPIGHSLPFRFPEWADEIRRVVDRAAKAVGVDQTLLNLDLMLTDEGVQVLEIGARMGATCMAELMAIHTGIDPLDLALDLALGRPVDFREPGATQPCAARVLMSPTDGCLGSVQVPPCLAGDPDLLALRWDKRPGERVRAFRSGQDRIGELLVRGATWEDSEARCHALAAKLGLVVEPVRGQTDLEVPPCVD